MSEKASLRAEMRAQRLGISASWAASASLEIVVRLRRLFEGSSDVALYWPMVEQGEVDLRSLARRGSEPYDIHLPYMENGSEGFRLMGKESEFVRAAHSFLQPAATQQQSLKLSWIAAPALAASPSGHRLGYGSGFYDRALSRRERYRASVVVIFEQQLCKLPVEPHDEPCDWLVTEERTICCRLSENIKP